MTAAFSTAGILGQPHLLRTSTQRPMPTSNIALSHRTPSSPAARGISLSGGWWRSMLLVAAVAMPIRATELWAQADGLVAFPEVYSVQLENPWVRLVRVRLPAGANLAMHSHPPGFMFHVYLNDADPVLFSHDGAPYEITRPPVTARSYRIGTATPEVHAVLNPSERPSDYLRVEYKTRDSEHSRRRVHAPPLPDTSIAVVEHSGASSRVTRVTLAPRDSAGFDATDAQPALFIFVTDATITDGTGTAVKQARAGDERFVAPGGRLSLRNTGNAPLQLLRFDFLTPPSTSP